MTRLPRLLAALPLLLALRPAAAQKVTTTPAVHVPFIEGRPFAEVLARAQRAKKPIFLDVYASWCGPCKMMDRTTFSDQRVVDWMAAHVIPARVDAEKGEGRKIASRYGVGSFPTMLFLEPNGNEIDRILGAQPQGAFERYGDEILSGRGPLAGALDSLKKQWNQETAIQVVTALGERNDLPRLRPIALRVINEDPDLTDSRTLGTLAVLATMEDRAGALSPETGDLIDTYLPKIGADPRRGVLVVILARELSRRGDAAGLRELAAKSIPTMARDGYLSDLYAALGEVERKGRAYEASAAAYRNAVAILEELQFAPGVLTARRLELAETLVDAGKGAEARSLFAKALEALPEEPSVLARVASLQAKNGDTKEALKNARAAVEKTKGEDAYAQAALAHALLASGDGKGAKQAWSRAHSLEPDNPEYGKPLGKTAS